MAFRISIFRDGQIMKYGFRHSQIKYKNTIIGNLKLMLSITKGLHKHQHNLRQKNSKLAQYIYTHMYSKIRMKNSIPKYKYL